MSAPTQDEKENIFIVWLPRWPRLKENRKNEYGSILRQKKRLSAESVRQKISVPMIISVPQPIFGQKKTI